MNDDAGTPGTGIKKKKRGSHCESPVPQLEAFALPTSSERATQKPTQLCITTDCTHCLQVQQVYNIPIDIYRCFVL
ncbi:MAG: hypothetical protein IKY71_04805 [Bacteroidaceae bacterium]|nr:hypothetical protein [Bacteroidaceae bacterium]